MLASLQVAWTQTWLIFQLYKLNLINCVVKLESISYPFIRNNPTPTSNSQHNIQGTTRTPSNDMTCCFTHFIWEQKASKFIHDLNYCILLPKKGKKAHATLNGGRQNYKSIHIHHKLIKIHLISSPAKHYKWSLKICKIKQNSGGLSTPY